MSRPRAATSVATRTANRFALKSASARTRCGWLLLPWMAVAGMPSCSSWVASRLAPCLVRVKTSAWSIRPLLTRWLSSSRLRSRSTGWTTWVTSSVGVLRGVTWTEAGSCEQAGGQPPDLVREGRREQQVLAPGRQDREDLADVADEAHVEHPVGLVEDEDLDARQVDRALADVVEQAARRGDDDLGDRRAGRGPADRSRRRRRWWSSGSVAAAP